MDDATRHLAHTTQILESLSYQRVLERGFVLARDEAGEPVTEAARTAPGMALSLRFHDGEVPATVGAGAARPVRRPRKPAPDDDDQGSLL